MTWWSRLLRNEKLEYQLATEIRFHFENKVADNIRSGMSRGEAERAARIEMGGIDRLMEECRDARGTRWLQNLFQDFRLAFRSLGRSPGFAAAAICTLALGIGATSAIFSFADGLLFRPLPVPGASEVVTLRSRTPSGTFGEVSWRDYEDFRDQNRSFSGLVAYKLAPLWFAADAKAVRQLKYGFLVSGNFFDVLGIEPRIGRAFRPDEGKVQGRDAVVVLGYDFWKSDFGGDSSVTGTHVRLNGTDFTIIGVAPESFTGMDQYVRPAFFVPAMMGPTLYSNEPLTDRGDRSYVAKGRLYPGISIQAADAESRSLAKSIETSHPDTNRAYGAALRTEVQTRLDRGPAFAMILGVLFSVVTVALLVTCVNVATLTLSRGRSRTRETAVRLAIGAGRGRVLVQPLLESLLIALAGGSGGLLVARFFVAIFSDVQIPGDIPVQVSFLLDHRLLWFTVVVSCASALIFGLAPALLSTRVDLVTSLKSGQTNPAGRRFLGRNSLVIAQVAGSLILLVAATQLYGGFSSLLSRNPGFKTSHLILMGLDPSLVHYTPSQIEQFYKTLPDRALTVPGIKSAALMLSVPMGAGQIEQPVIPEGYQFPVGFESVSVETNIVDTHFFDTFGVPILQGRGFLASDRPDSVPVAIVNEAFAQRYFGQNPVGKRFRLDRNGRWIQIVGVSVTGKYHTLFEPPANFLYLPLSQNPQANMKLVAETYGDPAALSGPLREMIRSLDPALPVFGVRTISDYFTQGYAVKMLSVIEEVVASAAFLALALALVGLYAVMSYQVIRRTREIGICMAVGASRMRVSSMILKQAAIVSSVGVAIGVALSIAAGRALTLQAAAPPFEPGLFTIVALTLFVTTLIAAWIPAVQATRINPTLALRQD